MLRFIAYAVPLLVLLLALFGFTVELLDAEPRKGSVIRLALFEQPRVPGQLVLGTWLVEASGLIALFLLAQGRFGAWWLDGLVAGWVAWVFRGPLLVITIVVAARQAQDPWWKLAFGWWVLYSVCGLSLALLARRSGLGPWVSVGESGAAAVEPAAAPEASVDGSDVGTVAPEIDEEPPDAEEEPDIETPAPEIDEEPPDAAADEPDIETPAPETDEKPTETAEEQPGIGTTGSDIIGESPNAAEVSENKPAETTGETAELESKDDPRDGKAGTATTD